MKSLKVLSYKETKTNSYNIGVQCYWLCLTVSLWIGIPIVISDVL